MFSFFKKQKPDTNFGWFTTYGMEDIYYFLTEKRIQKKIDELKDARTLFGTRFEDFVSEKSYKSASGELHFLKMLIWFFRNDLDIAILSYEKSKNFSEENYPFKEILNEDWQNHLKSMDRLSVKNPEKLEIYSLQKRPVYWLEFNLFYEELLKNLFFNYNLQKLSKVNFVGEFPRKGNLIVTPEIEIIFALNRTPSIGNVLVFRQGDLLKEIKVRLIEVQKDKFNFETKFGSYSLELSSEKAFISKINEINDNNINLIKSMDLLGIIEKIIAEYISNFEKITKRYISEITKTEIVFFFVIALRIRNLNPNLIELIKTKIVSKGGFWGDLDRYYITSIQGFDF